MTTDEPDEQLAPVSPEDEARIRALLSGARETGPIPAGVGARMDRALVGLAAERVTVDPVPADNVIHLARTRRHRVVAVLGAAAAVAVLGLGIGTFFDRSGDDVQDASSADSGFARGDDEAANPEANAADAAPTESGSDDSLNDLDEFERKEIAGDRAFPVHSSHLSRDLARIQGIVLPRPDAADYSRTLIHAPKGFSCRTAQWGRGILVGVRYDGTPAFVAFREPMGDSQVVEVLQCGTGDLLRSTTLPTAG